ncbi:MAG: phosphoribosylformylglycinamidine synthase subunit PurL [Planctomycetota bacterium]
MAAGSPNQHLFRIEVQVREGLSDARGNAARDELTGAGLTQVRSVRSILGYAISLTGGRSEVERVAERVLTDPVAEKHAVLEASELARLPPGFQHRVDVVKKPGVMDPAADGVMRAVRAAGVTILAAHTYQAYLIDGAPDAASLREAAVRVLGNEAIEEIRVDGDQSTHRGTLDGVSRGQRRIEVALPAEDELLLRVSAEGGLSLNLLEMRAIRDHFLSLGRNPSDVELETIAQTWSEHCKHKTLAGRIRIGDRTYDNMLKETIFDATRRLDLPWCVSVFVDNAGVVEFDDDFHVTFKVETHNHPSAIEPYGGAGTGIGGVLRDTMGTGLGARPIVSTDVFCFGPPDLPREEVPAGALHPLRVLKGVVAGVRDYGNRMGIPTANGAVLFDRRYTGNPLVFCGSVGLLPADRVEKSARPGDLVVVVGGRTGRDGMHGATFSSRELHSGSETIDSGAVQIGNAICEKRVLDVLLRARDLDLFTCVTDCGAGGLSSAVGETAEHCGAIVHLDRVPLKYAGLTYTEAWISEAQERMVLSVPPEKADRLLALFTAEDVEATVIGEYTQTGRLELLFDREPVADLDLDFLHNGLPRTLREARDPERVGREPDFPCPGDLGASLLKLLALPNVASKAWIVHQYDHEVQAGSVVKPFVGKGQLSPGDGAVVRPRLDSDRGIAVGCGINPAYGEIDPYQMALLCVDEAFRNVIAVGGRSDRVALLDNFCAGSCERPEILGAVVRIAEACRDASLALQAPFISGKDSLNNEYRTDNGTEAIPTTLLISSVALVDDVRRSVTSDLKEAGNSIVLIGLTRAELGGSSWYQLHRELGSSVPTVDLGRARKVFEAVSRLVATGLLRACHDLSDGGLGVALAEMTFSGGIGAEVDLEHVPRADDMQRSVARNDTLLFAESPTRFVAEVRPGDLESVATILQDVPHAVIGQTIEECRLRVIGLDRSLVVDEEVKALEAAFSGRLDFGSPAGENPRGSK